MAVRDSSNEPEVVGDERGCRLHLKTHSCKGMPVADRAGGPEAAWFDWMQ